MMAISPIEHSRVAKFPRGFVVDADSAMSLLGAAEASRDASMTPVRWELDGKDWTLRGSGSEDFAKALDQLPGDVINFSFSGGRYVGSPRHLQLITGMRLVISIRGPEWDWVNGTKERFDAVIKSTFHPSLIERWKGLPVAVIAVVAAWVIVGSLAAWISPASRAAPIPQVLAALLVSLFFLQWSQLWPEYTIRIAGRSAGTRSPWYQTPVVEGARTIAFFIGALWALLQIAQWVLSAVRAAGK